MISFASHNNKTLGTVDFVSVLLVKMKLQVI